MKNLYLLFSLLLTPILSSAQDNLDIVGNAVIQGNLGVNNIDATGMSVNGTSPLRIITSGTTVLDLQATNPMIDFKDLSANQLAFIQSFGSDFYISNRKPGKMFFRTNNLNRMAIDADGNVGIGNVNPASKLTINGPDNNGTIAGLEVNSGGQKIILDGNELDCTTGGLHINVNSLNDLLVRTTTRRAEFTFEHALGSGLTNGFSLSNPGSNSVYWTMYSTNGDGNLELYYKGNLRGEFNSTTGAYTNISDRRLKENIRPLTGVLPRVMELQPARYTFRGDPQQNQQIGFIAQDVFMIFPEVVSKGTEGDSDKEVHTMDYGALSVIALAAVKEIVEGRQPEIQALKAENQELKEKVKTLEARLAKLEEWMIKEGR